MNIEDAILSYDGKDISSLKAAAKEKFSAETVNKIIGFCESVEPLFQTSATWLLKAHLEKTGSLAPRQIDRLVAQLSKLETWESQLHILQIVRYLEISCKNLDTVVNFIDGAARHRNTFIRVWALDALTYLSDQHSQLDEAMGKALVQALDAKEASMRSRARNLLKGRSCP